MQSPRTIQTRRIFLGRLLWFLRYRRYSNCGTTELRQFLHYLMRGHEQPGGRWGNPQFKSEVRPITVKDYYVNPGCFFNWLTAEELIEVKNSSKFRHWLRYQSRESARSRCNHSRRRR